MYIVHWNGIKNRPSERSSISFRQKYITMRLKLQIIVLNDLRNLLNLFATVRETIEAHTVYLQHLWSLIFNLLSKRGRKRERKNENNNDNEMVLQFDEWKVTALRNDSNIFQIHLHLIEEKVKNKTPNISSTKKDRKHFSRKNYIQSLSSCRMNIVLQIGTYDESFSVQCTLFAPIKWPPVAANGIDVLSKMSAFNTIQRQEQAMEAINGQHFRCLSPQTLWLLYSFLCCLNSCYQLFIYG